MQNCKHTYMHAYIHTHTQMLTLTDRPFKANWPAGDIAAPKPTLFFCLSRFSGLAPGPHARTAVDRQLRLAEAFHPGLEFAKLEAPSPTLDRKALRHKSKTQRRKTQAQKAEVSLEILHPKSEG